MNRRSFLSAILKAGSACAILPSAVTYARKWKQVESGLSLPIFEIVTDSQNGLAFMFMKWIDKEQTVEICSGSTLHKIPIKVSHCNQNLEKFIAEEKLISIHSNKLLLKWAICNPYETSPTRIG